MRVFPVLGRNLGEPVCWSDPAGLLYDLEQAILLIDVVQQYVVG